MKNQKFAAWLVLVCMLIGLVPILPAYAAEAVTYADGAALADAIKSTTIFYFDPLNTVFNDTVTINESVDVNLMNKILSSMRADPTNFDFSFFDPDWADDPDITIDSFVTFPTDGGITVVDSDVMPLISILRSFTGELNAACTNADEAILSLSGIEVMQRVTKMDFTDNKIESLLPISRYHFNENDYFNPGKDGDNIENCLIILKNNPIYQSYTIAGAVKGNTNEYYMYGNEIYNIISLDGLSLSLPIKLQPIKVSNAANIEPIDQLPLDKSVSKTRIVTDDVANTTRATLKQSDNKKFIVTNSDFTEIYVENIKKSGLFELNVASTAGLAYYQIVDGTDYTQYQATSVNYKFTNEINLFSPVALYTSGTAKFNVVFTKFKEDGTTPLAGAKFKLERQTDDNETPTEYTDDRWETVGEPLVTNDNGQFDNLTVEIGTYRLSEIDVPNGYTLNTTPVIFTADFSAELNGTELSDSITASHDSNGNIVDTSVSASDYKYIKSDSTEAAYQKFYKQGTSKLSINTSSTNLVSPNESAAATVKIACTTFNGTDTNVYANGETDTRLSFDNIKVANEWLADNKADITGGVVIEVIYSDTTTFTADTNAAKTMTNTPIPTGKASLINYVYDIEERPTDLGIYGAVKDGAVFTFSREEGDLLEYAKAFDADGKVTEWTANEAEAYKFTSDEDGWIFEGTDRTLGAHDDIDNLPFYRYKKTDGVIDSTNGEPNKYYYTYKFNFVSSPVGYELDTAPQVINGDALEYEAASIVSEGFVLSNDKDHIDCVAIEKKNSTDVHAVINWYPSADNKSENVETTVYTVVQTCDDGNIVTGTVTYEYSDSGYTITADDALKSMIIGEIDESITLTPAVVDTTTGQVTWSFDVINLFKTTGEGEDKKTYTYAIYQNYDADDTENNHSTPTDKFKLEPTYWNDDTRTFYFDNTQLEAVEIAKVWEDASGAVKTDAEKEAFKSEFYLNYKYGELLFDEIDADNIASLGLNGVPTALYVQEDIYRFESLPAWILTEDNKPSGQNTTYIDNAAYSKLSYEIKEKAQSDYDIEYSEDGSTITNTRRYIETAPQIEKFTKR